MNAFVGGKSFLNRSSRYCQLVIYPFSCVGCVANHLVANLGVADVLASRLLRCPISLRFRFRIKHNLPPRSQHAATVIERPGPYIGVNVPV